MQRNAWHLTLENQQSLAIAQQQVVEYLHNVEGIFVPDCARHCQQVVIWRDRIVPLLGTAGLQQPYNHVLVILYQDGAVAAPVALALQSPPQALVVHDQDQCAADEGTLNFWGSALLCCIKGPLQPIALVDFSQLH